MSAISCCQQEPLATRAFLKLIGWLESGKSFWLVGGGVGVWQHCKQNMVSDSVPVLVPVTCVYGVTVISSTTLLTGYYQQHSYAPWLSYHTPVNIITGVSGQNSWSQWAISLHSVAGSDWKPPTASSQQPTQLTRVCCRTMWITRYLL